MKRLRPWSVLTASMFVLLWSAVSPGQTDAAPAGFVRYTITAFTNSSETNTYIYESGDATTFRLLAGPAYTPPTGLVRDPSVLRHHDGWYYVVYTTGWDGNTIGFARSRDRVRWHFLRNYTIPFPGVAHTWAPEWFVDSDGSVNVLVSISTGGDFQPVLLRALDPAMTMWAGPIPLIGIGMNHIDTVLVKLNGMYHAFTKNEHTKFVEHAIGVSPVGPFAIVGHGNWAGWGAPREGQSLAPLPGGGWRIFLDGYTEGKYFFSDSFDGFRTWTPPRELPGLSGFVRHFTILTEVG